MPPLPPTERHLRCAPSFLKATRKRNRLHFKRRIPKAEAIHSRRTVLLASSVPLLQRPASFAQDISDQSVKASDRQKLLKSAAGFQLSYPASWLVAFDRGESNKEGTIALVGNFVYIDTFSVERLPFEPSKGPPSVEALAQDLIEPIQFSPSSMNFEILNKDYFDGRQGEKKYYVVEYEVVTCKGAVTEGLGGKKLCRDGKGNDLLTVARHHLLGIVQTIDATFVLNGSCPSNRWTTVEADLRTIVRSFAADDQTSVQ